MANLFFCPRVLGRLWFAFSLAIAGSHAWPALGQAPMDQPAQEQVADVQIVGNTTIPKATVIRSIYTRAGRTFDLDTIREDVRRLNATGMYIDVKTYSQQVPTGGRIVVFEVVERPMLQDVKYVGNLDVKKSVLEKETGLKVGKALDPYAIEEGRSKIEAYYRSKGFGDVRVTIVEGDKPTDRNAIYLINEGRKQKVLWTKFVGNTIASDARLLTQIQSKPPVLYIFKGEVDHKLIDEDVNRLTAYYRSLGFFRAKISRELEFNASQNWLWLTFVIDEGPRYKVRNLSFIGNKRFKDDELIPRLDLKDSQYFNQSQMTKDVAMLQEKYGSIGYVFADVKAEPRFLEEPGALDLVYDITEGDRYTVGRIDVQIKGEYPHTRIAAVLNRISLVPGDIVDIRKLRASERRLKASGLFMVDPTTGSAPKIVFSPPETEDPETEFARRPKGSPSVRGQSPDLVPCGQWQCSPSPDSFPGDRRLDFTLPCRWSNPQSQQYAASHPECLIVPGPETLPEPSDVRQDPVWPNATQTTPASQPAALPWPGQPSPVQEAAPTIVRGQDGYSGDWGRTVPQFPSRGPTSTTWSQSSSSGPSSASNYAPQTAPAPAYNAPSTGGTASPYQTAPYATTGSGSASGASSAAPSSPPAYPPAYPPSSPPAYPPAYPPSLPPAYPPASGAGAPWPPGGAPAVAAPAYGNPYDPGPGLFNPASPFVGPDDEELTRPLPFRVVTNEERTGRLMFGVGINSDAGLIGSIVVDEQNFDWTRVPRSWEEIRNATAFRGAGQRFRLEAVPGTQVQRYMVNFQEPYLFDTSIGLGLSGYFYNRWYREYTEERVGGRASLAYRFEALPDLSCSLAYRGAKINIQNPIKDIPQLTEVLGNNALHGFGFQIAHDTRDNAFLATEGHLIEWSVEQVIGSFEYLRAEVDMRRFFLLHERPDGSGRHVLSLSGRMGYTGDNTPIYENYFIGGFSTLRGFDFREASPREQGVLVGGHFQALASAQYLFPITADDMLRAVVFCDTGVVQPSIKDWRDKYRVAPGFGLRITMPAMGPAPIALDFAFPIVKDRDDQTEVFSFFVGFNQ